MLATSQFLLFHICLLVAGRVFPAHFRNSKWMLHINLCTEARTRMCLRRQGVKVPESRRYEAECRFLCHVKNVMQDHGTVLVALLFQLHLHTPTGCVSRRRMPPLYLRLHLVTKVWQHISGYILYVQPIELIVYINKWMPN